MSRSGYIDDCEHLAMWRGRVASATRGKRGQTFFKRLVESLEAMPEKALVAHDIRNDDGDVCALGAAIVCLNGEKLASALDPEDHDAIGGVLNISPCLVQEVEHMNDEWGDPRETPQHRYDRMLAWAKSQITKEPTDAS